VLRKLVGSESNAEIPVVLLENGAVMSKFHGGIEAEEALAQKDFKRFVAIQMEAHKERVRMEARKVEKVDRIRQGIERSFSQWD